VYAVQLFQGGVSNYQHIIGEVGVYCCA